MQQRMLLQGVNSNCVSASHLWSDHLRLIIVPDVNSVCVIGGLLLRFHHIIQQHAEQPHSLTKSISFQQLYA